jgi:hypothetical protein
VPIAAAARRRAGPDRTREPPSAYRQASFRQHSGGDDRTLQSLQLRNSLRAAKLEIAAFEKIQVENFQTINGSYSSIVTTRGALLRSFTGRECKQPVIGRQLRIGGKAVARKWSLAAGVSQPRRSPGREALATGAPGARPETCPDSSGPSQASQKFPAFL